MDWLGSARQKVSFGTKLESFCNAAFYCANFSVTRPFLGAYFNDKEYSKTRIVPLQIVPTEIVPFRVHYKYTLNSGPLPQMVPFFPVTQEFTKINEYKYYIENF